jgi:hypothetical protein
VATGCRDRLGDDCHNMTACDHNRNMTTTHKCATTSHKLGTDAGGGGEWKKKAVRVTCGRTYVMRGGSVGGIGAHVPDVIPGWGRFPSVSGLRKHWPAG